MSRDRVVPL